MAYRLLGSLEDADDAVQTAWLKSSRADLGAVQEMAAWFTTVTVRECLDQLRARRRRIHAGRITAIEVIGDPRRLAATALTLLADSPAS
jgi:RNA polymerase sigma-70 factor, ECF subfamily